MNSTPDQQGIYFADREIYKLLAGYFLIEENDPRGEDRERVAKLAEYLEQRRQDLA